MLRFRQKDCSDGSDELDCPSCQPNQFRCQDGQCIDKTLVCNNVADCADRSDEKNCCENGFQCPQTEVCLSPSLKCDGTEHCADGSDERGCQTEVPISTITLLVVLVAIIAIVLLSIFFYHKNRCFPVREDVVEPPEDSLSPLDPNGHNKNLNLRRGKFVTILLCNYNCRVFMLRKIMIL